MRHALGRVVAAVTLVLIPLVALAGDTPVAEAVRAAVGALVHGDAAARAEAEQVLASHPEAAVPALLRLVTELRAGRSKAPSAGAPTGASAPAASAASAAASVLQLYDVRDLVRGRLTLDLLRGRVESAGGTGTQARAHGDGVLVVVAPPAAHEVVAAALHELRSRDPAAFAIGSHLVVARPGAALGADLSALRPGAVAAIDDVAQRLALWEAGGDAQLRSSPVVLTLGDEPASVAVGREVSFVEDVEIDVAEGGGFVADPVVASTFDGLELEFRAHRSDAGIQLTVDATVTDLAESFDVVTSDLGVLSEPVRIQRPSFVRTEIGRLVALADGGSFVLRLPDTVGGARRLLVVTARRERVPDEERDD